MFRVEQHLVPHCKLHLPPVGVELRLAPILPLCSSARTSAVIRPIRWAAASPGSAGSAGSGASPRRPTVGRGESGGDAGRGRRRRACDPTQAPGEDAESFMLNRVNGTKSGQS